MIGAAKRLEFEQATALRDELKKARDRSDFAVE